MRILVAALVVGVALAGCVADSEDLGVDGAGAALATEPAQAAAGAVGELPLLGPAFDPWGEAQELLLFEGTVESVECGGPIGQVFGTTYYLTELGTLGWGCTNWLLPDGTHLPEGTGTLRIEADASAATRQGSWGPYITFTAGGATWQSGNRSVEGEPIDGPEGTWTFPITPNDWDPPSRAGSGLMLGVWAYGSPHSMLRGPVHVTATAVRDPAWVPLPRIDLWALYAEGSEEAGLAVPPMPQEGVITLFDAKGPLGDVPFTNWMAHAIPEGTTHVIAGVAWGGALSDCASINVCAVRPFFWSHGRWTFPDQAAQSEAADGSLLFVLDAPSQAAPDSQYQTRPLSRLHLYVEQCTGGTPVPGVGCPFVAGGEFSGEARLLVEAWQGDVDLAAFKARLGAT